MCNCTSQKSGTFLRSCVPDMFQPVNVNGFEMKFIVKKKTKYNFQNDFPDVVKVFLKMKQVRS